MLAMRAGSVARFALDESKHSSWFRQMKLGGRA